MNGESGESGTRTRESGDVFGPRMTLCADVLSVGLATARQYFALPLAFLAPGPLALALTAVDVRRAQGS